jgi:hypothetical protein
MTKNYLMKKRREKVYRDYVRQVTEIGGAMII